MNNGIVMVSIILWAIFFAFGYSLYKAVNRKVLGAHVAHDITTYLAIWTGVAFCVAFLYSCYANTVTSQ